MENSRERNMDSITQHLKMVPSHTPAVDHNGSVPTPALHIQDAANGIHNCRGVAALTIRTPVVKLELGHMMYLPNLRKNKKTNKRS